MCRDFIFITINRYSRYIGLPTGKCLFQAESLVFCYNVLDREAHSNKALGRRLVSRRRLGRKIHRTNGFALGT